MKKLLTIIVLFISLCTVLVFAAETNYRNAVASAVVSDGSDSGIQDVMSAYGFNNDWHEDITMTDKVKALFNL